MHLSVEAERIFIESSQEAGSHIDNKLETNMLARFFFSFAFGLLMSISAVAQGQTFPDKPVRVLMPFPAGTGPDAVMRLVGERLTRIWKQPVIIENRPGGNSFLAMTAAKRASPDGYTLVLVDYSNVSVLPHLFPKTIPFDPQKDFDAVSPMYWAYWFLAVAGDSKPNSVVDFVADVKARGSAYNFGSSGVGSPMHLQAAMFANTVDLNTTHIPYKETPQILVDISRHEIGWAFTTGATGGPLFKSGKIRFLAVASPQRHPAFPDVPTMVESGGPPNFDLRTWVAMFAPKGVPKPILEKLNVNISNVLADPAVRDQLVILGLEPWIGSTSALTQQMEADSKKYGELTSRLKISLD